MTRFLSARNLVASGVMVTLFTFAASSGNAAIVIDDAFSDGDITTNTMGIGTGFTAQTNSSGAAVIESGGIATASSATNGGRRASFRSNDTVNTNGLGASFLFEGVSHSVNSGDAVADSLRRNFVGVRQDGTEQNGLGDIVARPGTGYFVLFDDTEIANFVGPNGTGAAALPDGQSALVFYDDGPDYSSTILASWDFDTLNLGADDVGAITTPELDVLFSVDGDGWSLNILGDTADGGNPIAFAGTHVASGSAPLIDAQVIVGNQSEDPNLDLSVSRVVVTTAVPEPTSVALLGLGMVGVITRRRRR